ncbi:hypothetical protein NW765_011942 [Fusarium oxysporum]|nr:hypothetical protein NW765_011942 [Fusarium oxysporum]
MASNMSPLSPTSDRRYSDDSISSASTTSLVFDRIQEKTMMDASRDNNDSRALEDDDPLKEEDDLETGPFLGPGASLHREPMDRGLRRILIIVGSVFVAAWLIGLGTFLYFGSYHHESDTEHDPDAATRGSGKAVTMDQLFSGFWQAKSHSISWIGGPDGEDGLLLEVGASEKPYIVVEDIRNDKETRSPIDTEVKASKSRTLMKDNFFVYEGNQYSPEWNEPSPDLKKVLLGVEKEEELASLFQRHLFHSRCRDSRS